MCTNKNNYKNKTGLPPPLPFIPVSVFVTAEKLVSL